ncbi:Putative transcriptional regulator, TetR family [Mycobacteroides abscessus subsp. bolletii]|uniref:Transcriptional regulator, TetR family n=1 Tax=Mycobacteroides abscessus subsp. bolletii TaxID=319705 RepID=A0A9Q7WJ82_9MYCO|nr:TetR family transcriptional regulator [Mycobacteroides abscessus]EHM18425.1 TetR family transcriptional regulator [Mycobacteroides abscessus subsp. bolletii BD]ORA28114.1 TetR family transcriptional regulator [Mycobacteroides abscessus subsp. bolletii]TPF65972.1 TetR family transcriptional regulator [Mycobacteroides abscessus subsp. bolletii]UEA46951.1 TetR family transcriptional regulator [Mycobacteroides abscessus subsp. abscessus]UEA53073.1 TetR family transcriptional regulator [Mycobact
MTRAGTKGMPRAERERQILDAACQEFGRSGYVGMSLAAVAAAVGVSKPMVLAYFGSKEQLYIACVERAGATVGDHIEAAMTAAPPTLALPRAVLQAIFQALAPRPSDWLVIWDQTLPDGSEALAAARVARTRLAALAGQGVAAVGSAATQLRDAQDIGVLTQGWMGMVGAMITWWIRHPEQSAEQMAERASRLIAIIASAGISEAEAPEGGAVPRPGTPVRGSGSGQPLNAAFDLFGRRWAILVVWELRSGAKTLPELKAEMGDASSSVLATRLKELTAAHIVRNQDGQYSLTTVGKGLLVALAPLHLWAKAWSASVR